MPGADYNEIKKSHFGDAHENWDDVDWSDYIMEEIDYNNKYVQ